MLKKILISTALLISQSNAMEINYSLNAGLIYIDIEKSKHVEKENFIGANLTYELSTPILEDTNLIYGAGIDFINQSGNIYFFNAGLSYKIKNYCEIKILGSYNLKNDADYPEYSPDKGLGYELMVSIPLYKADESRNISLFMNAKQMFLKGGLGRNVNRVMAGLNAPF